MHNIEKMVFALSMTLHTDVHTNEMTPNLS